MIEDTIKSIANPIENKSERRRNLRFPVVGSVEVVDVKSQTKIVGRMNDIGLGGCHVDTLSPFPTGSHVKLTIERGMKSFVAEGKVVHSETGMGMALTAVNPASRLC